MMTFFVKAHYGTEKDASEVMEELSMKEPQMERYLRRDGSAICVRTEERKKIDVLRSFFEEHTDPISVEVAEEKKEDMWGQIRGLGESLISLGGGAKKKEPKRAPEIAEDLSEEVHPTRKMEEIRDEIKEVMWKKMRLINTIWESDYLSEEEKKGLIEELKK